jgi:hypothetical protein
VKVLVCDDIKDRCTDVGERVRQSGQDCQCLYENALTAELRELFATARSSMKEPNKYSAAADSPFDRMDIVILDNNLTLLETPGGEPLTAESIAGYVRAFTKASYIVSLNLNPDADFDLDYLVGDFSTRADVAVNTDHLSNAALWNRSSAPAEDGFLPWYWPRLESVPKQRQQQIEFVRTRLDQPVLKVLGFDDDAIDLLSPHARGALSPEAGSDREIARGAPPLKDVTFRDHFIVKDRSIPLKPARQALSKAEKAGNRELTDVIARVVAADIDLWFRRDIVGPQEPLVDVPHLLMRFPFLLGKGAGDIEEWNKAVRADSEPYGLDKELYSTHLAEKKFEHDLWVPSACFWWPKLRMDEKLNGYFFEAKQGDWADVVFCEDCSKFLERSPEHGKAPTEFPAEFEGAWGRRHIARIDDRKYSPRSRLAI